MISDPLWQNRYASSEKGEAPEPSHLIPPASVPGATYRLQFNSRFTFRDATALVPYLNRLGISHCYASPYLKARAGSTHGYDIVDHSTLNPEIGTLEEYDQFVEALHRHGMGQILDTVPNHVGIGGNDSAWWLDVLENGQASVYAAFFDIDWSPLKDELRGKVLVPFLGGSYGSILEKGELRLTFDAERGNFGITYYDHYFPIDPKSYPKILNYRLERLEEQLSSDDLRLVGLKSLISAFSHLPAHWETVPEKVEERSRDKEVHKRHLAALCRESDEISAFIGETVDHLNGRPGERSSFDPLHDLLQGQPYRLASWRVASDEINYRRFFDVNNLASLRQEVPEVFEATHRFILDLIAEGKIDGLRIDHPDGLYDPAGYYGRLQDAVRKSGLERPLYLVVEKILALHERLREDWPVHGTTGYEFANQVNGLFVDPAAERQMTSTYAQFNGPPEDFITLVERCKKLIMKDSLASELNVLANQLNRISESDRDTRDFSLNRLRNALFELVASFPVYRTYVTGQRITDEDRRYIEWAVTRARSRGTAADQGVYDFVRQILLLEAMGERQDESYREAVVRFAMKFQQYTAPIMAKGLEDTAFYMYNRLVSLNDVGGDPEKFGLSVPEFHRHNAERARLWPFSLLSTSTHDSKRSEDVRARINVLTEMPAEWRLHVLNWRRINRGKRRRTRDGYGPSGSDEYLLYQTLIGSWPLGELDESGYADYCARIEAYMVKAAKEAKMQMSWVTPNPEYEEALVQFCRDVLKRGEDNLFLAEFVPFQRRIAHCGLLNSLAQVLLKCMSPGVPDIYQGNELWTLSLVDPDNRRPVDYEVRQNALNELREHFDQGRRVTPDRVRALLDTFHDGKAKLFLTWMSLHLRRRYPDLSQGEYLPLPTGGSKGEHICAFARHSASINVVVAVPRWFHRLLENLEFPLGEGVWGDTWVEAPPAADRFRNVLTGTLMETKEFEGRRVLPAALLYADFPVALLASC